jgi:hypothetical protein
MADGTRRERLHSEYAVFLSDLVDQSRVCQPDSWRAKLKRSTIECQSSLVFAHHIRKLCSRLACRIMTAMKCERQLPILLNFRESGSIMTGKLGSAINCTVHQVSDQGDRGRYYRYDNGNPILQS